ncbi:MAG: hypothetical protein QM758_19170 [Armatimonas sp.]
MERMLLFVVLFCGVLLSGLTIWLPPRVRLAPPPKNLYLTLGLALLAVGLTLPSGGYFAIGGQLGLGCALGALTSAIGCWLSAEQTDPWKRRISATAPVLIALSLGLLFFRASLFDLLGGIALGWLGVGMLMKADAIALALPSVLIAGVAIAGYREAPAGEMAAMLLLTAGAMAFSFFTRLWSGWRGLLAAGLLLALEGRWLFTKVALGDEKLFWAALVGGAAALLLSRLPKTGALPLLLILGGHVAGSQFGNAYGAAVFSLTVLAVSLCLTEDLEIPSLGLLAGLIVYRWLPLRWPELRLGFADHHALPGLIVGALVPVLPLPPAPSPEEGGGASGSPSPLGEGLGRGRRGISEILLGASAVFGAITLLGARAGLPMGIGLALGMLREKASIGLALLGLFALVQFTGHVLPVLEAGRVVRLEVLVGLAVLGGAAWFVRSRERGV